MSVRLAMIVSFSGLKLVQQSWPLQAYCYYVPSFMFHHETKFRIYEDVKTCVLKMPLHFLRVKL